MSDHEGTLTGTNYERMTGMSKEITKILTVVAGIGGIGFAIGTLIGWLFLSDTMEPWQFGLIFALVVLFLGLLGAAPLASRLFTGRS